MTRTRERLSKARRLSAGALALVVAIATLFVGASGGLDYLWCAPMQQARAHCCCPPPSAEEAAHDRVELQCCELHHLGTLSSGVTHARAHAIVAASLVAVLPLEEVFRSAVLVSTLRRSDPREARAGPRQRPHAQHCVYLI